MKLRTQILMIMILPFLALTVLGALRGLDNWDRLISAEHAQVETEAGLGLVTVIHFLQVERGQSAAFLSSGGKVFRAELPQTRDKVNAAMAQVPASEAE